ncbi:hypothetical protein [Nostoc sp.]|uniref:hypothetical protein n=1 Tax=Nostoc sp. TaxID=1180 RepID=UPI002FFBDD31
MNPSSLSPLKQSAYVMHEAIAGGFYEKTTPNGKNCLMTLIKMRSLLIIFLKVIDCAILS